MNTLKSVYIGMGSSRETEGISYNPYTNLIAYVGSNLIALYNPVDMVNCVVGTLVGGHNSDVKCVSWMHGADLDGVPSECSGVGRLVSGDSDGVVCVWDVYQEGGLKFDGAAFAPSHMTKRGMQYVLRQRVDTKCTVTSVNSIVHEGRSFQCVTTADGRVLMFKSALQSTSMQYELNQTLQFHTWQIKYTAAFAVLPGTNKLLLAVAGVDTKVHLFYVSENDDQLVYVSILSGHNDWIRHLSFQKHGDDLFLGSACQDKTVRVWRFQGAVCVDRDVSQESLDDEDLVDERTVEQTLLLHCGNVSFSCTLDSVLLGHEEWVCCFRWLRDEKSGEQRVLTASADKTVVLWALRHGVWTAQVSLGEVGGNGLGFVNCERGIDGTIYGTSYGGSIYRWKHDSEKDTYTLTPGVTGHVSKVTGVYVTNDYIVSCSVDQTVRVSAPVRQVEDRLNDAVSWKELARPQVHGWNMVDVVPVCEMEHMYVGCSEERVLRVLEAPLPFIASTSLLSSKQPLTEDEIVDMFVHADSIAKSQQADDLGQDLGGNFTDFHKTHTRAFRAVNPELGLGNRREGAGDVVITNNNRFLLHASTSDDTLGLDAQSGLAQVLTSAPTELQLMGDSQWPEVDKLYGHGYDISCVASAKNVPLVASANHARKQKNAGIFLWNPRTWTENTQLLAHTASVLQMAFCPGNTVIPPNEGVDVAVDKYLVSIGKDQNMCVFRRNMTDSKYIEMFNSNKEALNPEYVLTDMKKVHTRQMLAMAWSALGQEVFTTSKDKQVKVSRIELDKLREVQTWTMARTVTCMTSTHAVVAGKLYLRMLLALDDNSIEVWCKDLGNISDLSRETISSASCAQEWRYEFNLPPSILHGHTVTKMIVVAHQDERMLVTVGNDHTVRVFQWK